MNGWMYELKKKNCHENEPTILQMVEQVLLSQLTGVTSVAHLLQGLMHCMLRDYLLHTLVHYNKQLQPRCESYCCLWSYCFKLNHYPLTSACISTIFAQRTTAHRLFSLFQSILCKPQCWLCGKFPVKRQFLKFRDHLSFLILTQFEFEQIPFSMVILNFFFCFVCF